jgi:hypothetical protein
LVLRCRMIYPSVDKNHCTIFMAFQKLIEKS